MTPTQFVNLRIHELLYGKVKDIVPNYFEDDTHAIKLTRFFDLYTIERTKHEVHYVTVQRRRDDENGFPNLFGRGKNEFMSVAISLAVLNAFGVSLEDLASQLNSQQNHK